METILARIIMPDKSALVALVAAADQSCRRIEAVCHHAPADLGPLLQQRRRMHAMLRAVLRWHGLELPAPEISARMDPVTLTDLDLQERQFLALYDCAIAQAAADAPELRLLTEQRATAVQARQKIRALQRRADHAPSSQLGLPKSRVPQSGFPQSGFPQPGRSSQQGAAG